MEKKRFYIGVDCEGVACAVGIPGQNLGDGENYAFAARQATREADAAARALFDMGAEEVIVWDNHHSGVNLDYGLLDPRCKILLGSGHHGRFPRIDESFGGVLFIGYHAREGSRPAVLAHTYSSAAYHRYSINGTPVGEMEIDAAFAGKAGVPVIFAASDDIGAAQARESFPWAETVATKEALSWTSAISLHPQESCRRIYEGVKKPARVFLRCSHSPSRNRWTFLSALNAWMQPTPPSSTIRIGSPSVLQTPLPVKERFRNWRICSTKLKPSAFSRAFWFFFTLHFQCSRSIIWKEYEQEMKE